MISLALFLILAFTTAANAGDRYCELRMYTVTSNKMDAVLERFRDTVEPVRRKHGIQTIGYWTTSGTTNGGTLVYLMTAAILLVLGNLLGNIHIAMNMAPRSEAVPRMVTTD